MTAMRQPRADAPADLGTALEGVDEVIRRSLARRRGMFDPADFDDLRSEVMLRLIRRLEDREAEPIESLASYAAIVTFHAVDDYGRKRFPERARLSNRIRFTLSRDSRFALWEVDGDLAGGLREWNGRAPVTLAGGITAGADIPAALLQLFRAAGGPLSFHALVTAFWRAAGEPRGAVLEVAVPAAPDRIELGERLWPEIVALPPRQRVALLLHLRDDAGETALIHLGISLDELASALVMPEDELGALWPELPLDDNRIATRLGATRQQVINLRKCARERLARRMARW